MKRFARKIIGSFIDLGNRFRRAKIVFKADQYIIVTKKNKKLIIELGDLSLEEAEVWKDLFVEKVEEHLEITSALNEVDHILKK